MPLADRQAASGAHTIRAAVERILPDNFINSNCRRECCVCGVCVVCA